MEVVAVFANPYGAAFTLRTHPWTLVAVDGVLLEILDLTNAGIQASLGTTVAELTGDWAYIQSTGGTPPTQLLGQEAFATGSILGLQYHSAKNLGKGIGVVVFSDRLTMMPPSSLEVVDPFLNLNQKLP